MVKGILMRFGLILVAYVGGVAVMYFLFAMVIIFIHPLVQTGPLTIQGVLRQLSHSPGAWIWPAFVAPVIGLLWARRMDARGTTNP